MESKPLGPSGSKSKRSVGVQAVESVAPHVTANNNFVGRYAKTRVQREMTRTSGHKETKALFTAQLDSNAKIKATTRNFTAPLAKIAECFSLLKDVVRLILLRHLG